MINIKWVLAAVLLAAAQGGAAQAAAYPDKPIHLIVGFSAGGASDVAARAVANKMAENLGQPIVVENKPGAASNIASSWVSRAAPDGYNVLFGTISLSINRSLYKNLDYDALQDLKPVSQLASAPFLLVVNPKSPIRSVADLIASAKKADSAHPVFYTTAGNGSGSHLFMELFASRAGINLTPVPYKGAAPAMTDVLGGQVPLTFDNIITTLPLVESGKLRALAVSSKQRSKVAPRIPTLAESGVPGYDATSWFGLFVPAGTPDAIVQRLSAAAAAAVNTSEVRAIFHGVGAEPVSSTPAAFQAFFNSEVKKWSEVITRAKIQLQ